MSEEKARFRIKHGDTELEYEGASAEVTERYKEAFDWIKAFQTMGNKDKAESPSKPQLKLLPGEKKKSANTAANWSGIWSPAVDDLRNGGYFKLPNRRTMDDIKQALTQKGLPTKGKDRMIKQTVLRKLRRGELKGTQGPDGWTLWME